MELPRTGGSFFSNLFHFGKTYRALADIVSEHDIEVVQTHLPKANFHGLILGKNSPAKVFSFKHVTDGLSTTFMFGEVVQGQGEGVLEDLRGFVWWGVSAGFTTYLAPNTSQPDILGGGNWCNSSYGGNPPCVHSMSGMPPMLAARSRHPAGIQAANCDGSARFLSETMDEDTLAAICTRAGGENVGDYFQGGR